MGFPSPWGLCRWHPLELHCSHCQSLGLTLSQSVSQQGYISARIRDMLAYLLFSFETWNEKLKGFVSHKSKYIYMCKLVSLWWLFLAKMTLVDWFNLVHDCQISRREKQYRSSDFLCHILCVTFSVSKANSFRLLVLFWVCDQVVTERMLFCFVFQHSASLAWVPAAAGPSREEKPVATLCVLREAEQLCQHEHLLRQQHTCECHVFSLWSDCQSFDH